MKKERIKLLLIFFVLVAISGCQDKVSYLTEAEIQEIRNDVKTVFEQSADAASRHDVEAITKFFWNNDEFLYAANGMLTNGWSNFKEVVKAVHSDPQNQDFRLEFENTYVKVINRDCALVTGAGKVIDFPTKEGPVNKNLTVTFLFEKIDDQWLITAGHESNPETLF
jgi:uncharacterized protein (TIGR02246 family)